MRGLFPFLAQRLFRALIALWLVSTVVFVVMKFEPFVRLKNSALGSSTVVSLIRMSFITRVFQLK